MPRLEAHGISIELPARWQGRVFRRPGGSATLHAGDFTLALDDGEFGDASTAAMPARSDLHRADRVPARRRACSPGRGLFAADRIPRRLDPSAFSPSRLAHPRRGQTGTQHFFTAAGRPLCLYVVVAASGAQRRRRLAVLDQVLGTLRVAPVATRAPS